MSSRKCSITADEQTPAQWMSLLNCLSDSAGDNVRLACAHPPKNKARQPDTQGILKFHGGLKFSSRRYLKRLKNSLNRVSAKCLAKRIAQKGKEGSLPASQHSLFQKGMVCFLRTKEMCTLCRAPSSAERMQQRRWTKVARGGRQPVSHPAHLSLLWPDPGSSSPVSVSCL